MVLFCAALLVQGVMVFALCVAFFLSPLAARNFSPNPVIYRIAREILNFMRAMPDLLLALIFVTALGLGPLPGALAFQSSLLILNLPAQRAAKA